MELAVLTGVLIGSAIGVAILAVVVATSILVVRVFDR